MTEQLTNAAVRQWLSRLHEIIRKRADYEVGIRDRSTESFSLDESQYAEGKARFEATYRSEAAALQAEFDETLQTMQRDFEAEFASAQGEFARIKQDAGRTFQEEIDAAHHEHEEAIWLLESILDDKNADNPVNEVNARRTQQSGVETQINSLWEATETAKKSLEQFLSSAHMLPGDEFPKAKVPAGDLTALQQRFVDANKKAEISLQALRKKFLPRLFHSVVPFFILLICAGGIGAGLAFGLSPEQVGLLNIDQNTWYGITFGGAAIVTLFIQIVLFLIGSGGIRSLYNQFQMDYVEAYISREKWKRDSTIELQRLEKSAQKQQLLREKKRVDARTKTDNNRDARIERATTERDRILRDANAKYPKLLNELQAAFETKWAETQKSWQARIDQHASEHQSRIREMETVHKRRVNELTEKFADEWNSLTYAWTTRMNQLVQQDKFLTTQCQKISPPWESIESPQWQAPEIAPEGVPYGRITVDMRLIENGLSNDSRLTPPKSHFRLPTLLTFGETPSLVMRVRDQGREAAVRLMQAMMLRMLTSLPPGKVRFTVVDPVGLGDNFSAFMHLADIDELLISGRIWSETSHIEHRLVQLTEHMETVFQTYLRNEFKTIDDYNRQAGEVAEPYRVLVIANFPTNFSDNAIKRLQSIAAGGARCGVFTMISVDVSAELPRGFNLSDLESSANVIEWAKGEFRPIEKEYLEFPLTVEAPPERGLFGNLVRKAGQLAKEARRVEVPFDRVAPPLDKVWSFTTQKEISVPIGRAGATNFQPLQLGRGTSQHVLISGKTGSGKSSLLHAMITNLALFYSPDEIQFFLVDFKKGVEFKTYAEHKLPHARVIAIESDREFGVSTLEKLDDILRERGDIFRKAGVQDITSYRRDNPNAVMPRVLLMVDEFHEFFIEDDSLSQTAALLLDRLVRQGRAFGVHIILGSQTLAGAYSLARSTLGQVAVRIALQSSDADAHLILSEDNTAARLLTRPGEAIYNDANGLIEGNHPFQVVWLDDAMRDRFLNLLETKSNEAKLPPPETIVFEGNIPADISRNTFLQQVLDRAPELKASGQRDTRFHPISWVGEAVAIRGPVDINFRPQSGNHVLIIGPAGEAAQGIMATTVVNLSAQLPPRSDGLKNFYLLDASDGLAAQRWARLQQAIPDLQMCPFDAADQTVLELYQAMKDGRTSTASPIVLMIYDLGRFRSLRKAEDDFGFGGGDSGDMTPPQAFTEILKEGPTSGVHVMFWVDSYNTFSRWISRDGMKQLDYRILFQVSAADSSNLIDSPAATKLGTNRAILYRGDVGTFEKFRPYAFPPDNWLDEAAQKLK